MENFVENQFITNIVPNIIATSNIKDLNITNDKLEDAIITSDKLGIFSNLPVVANGLTANHIDDGAIEPSKIKDNNIPVSLPASSDIMDLWTDYGRVYNYTTGLYNKQILKNEHILDASIGNGDLFGVRSNLDNLNRDAGIEAAKAFFTDVSFIFRFEKGHLALDKIPQTLFSADVQAAINRLKS